MEGMLKLYSPINELKQIGEDIWIIDGNEIHMSFKLFKVPFTTRMTIVKLDNNKLWIHSPIAFNKELNDKIKELGDIEHIIAPNKYHYSYVLDWYKHYPDAKVWLAKGVSTKLKIDERENFVSLDNISKTSWSEEILFTPFKGSIAMEEMVFFHKKSSTLILTDLIESIEVNKLPLLYKLVFKFGDNKYPKFRTSRDLRSSFIFKKKLKIAILRLKVGNPIKLFSLMER